MEHLSKCYTIKHLKKQTNTQTKKHQSMPVCMSRWKGKKKKSGWLSGPRPDLQAKWTTLKVWRPSVLCRGWEEVRKKLITKVFIFVLEPKLLPDAKGTVNFKDHFLHNHVPLLRLPRAVFSANHASRLQYGSLFIWMKLLTQRIRRKSFWLLCEWVHRARTLHTSVL